MLWPNPAVSPGIDAATRMVLGPVTPLVLPVPRPASMTMRLESTSSTSSCIMLA